MDRDEYLRRVKSFIKPPGSEVEQQLQTFCELCSYISGQYDQDESFQALRAHIEELEGDKQPTNRVFYMALPPSVFITVSQHLKRNCYPKSGIARIIVSCGAILFNVMSVDSEIQPLVSMALIGAFMSLLIHCPCLLILHSYSSSLICTIGVASPQDITLAAYFM